MAGSSLRDLLMFAFWLLIRAPMQTINSKVHSALPHTRCRPLGAGVHPSTSVARLLNRGSSHSSRQSGRTRSMTTTSA